MAIHRTRIDAIGVSTGDVVTMQQIASGQSLFSGWKDVGIFNRLYLVIKGSYTSKPFNQNPILKLRRCVDATGILTDSTDILIPVFINLGADYQELVDISQYVGYDYLGILVEGGVGAITQYYIAFLVERDNYTVETP